MHRPVAETNRDQWLSSARRQGAHGDGYVAFFLRGLSGSLQMVQSVVERSPPAAFEGFIEILYSGKRRECLRTTQLPSVCSPSSDGTIFTCVLDSQPMDACFLRLFSSRNLPRSSGTCNMHNFSYLNEAMLQKRLKLVFSDNATSSFV